MPTLIFPYHASTLQLQSSTLAARQRHQAAPQVLLPLAKATPRPRPLLESLRGPRQELLLVLLLDRWVSLRCSPSSSFAEDDLSLQHTRWTSAEPKLLPRHPRPFGRVKLTKAFMEVMIKAME
jgi:hypothetical protein